MTQANDENISKALAIPVDPETGTTFFELDRISDIKRVDNLVAFQLDLTPATLPKKPEIFKAFENELTALDEIEVIDIHWSIVGNQRPQAGARLPGVKHVIVVASGKGGVGKSTVATNLAVAMASKGLKVGLMDADIYGPSIPTMMGVQGKAAVDGEKILPMDAHGVKLVSIGFFIDEDQAVIWRGPMLHGALTQFFKDVKWGALDFLVIDMPPGTGDIQLTLAQTATISGCVIVTTPQVVSLKDVTKAFQMCRNEQVNIPVLGIVENMSGGIFGEGGGKAFAEKNNTKFLGSIPMVAEVVQAGDAGTPVILQNPDSAVAKAFQSIADQVIADAKANTDAGIKSIPIQMNQ